MQKFTFVLKPLKYMLFPYCLNRVTTLFAQKRKSKIGDLRNYFNMQTISAKKVTPSMSAAEMIIAV